MEVCGFSILAGPPLLSPSEEDYTYIWHTGLESSPDFFFLLWCVALCFFFFNS